MATLRVSSVQSGEATGSGTFSSVSVDITAVTLANTILLWSYRTGGATTTPGTGSIRGYFVDTDTITFERNDSDTLSMTIQWWVVEFSTGASVQHIEFTDVDDGETQSISAVDLSTSFIIHSGMRKGGSTYSSDDGLKLTFASTTSVTLEIGGSTPTDCDAAFQVVDIDDCSVTEITGSQTSYTSTQVSDSATFSDSTATMLFGSIENTSGSGFDDLYWTVYLGFGAVVMDRSGTGSSSFAYTTYMVEFTEPAVSIQHGNTTITSGNTHADEGVSSVDTSLVALVSKTMNNGNGSSGSYSVDEQYFTKSNFEGTVADATNIDFDRGAASANVNLQWALMEFIASSGNQTMAPTFAGTGALATVFSVDVPLSATFSGTGALALVTSVDYPFAPTFTGTGTFTVTTSTDVPLAPTFTGTGTLSIVPDVDVSMAPTFTGTGTLSIVSDVDFTLAPTFVGAGALDVTFTVDVPMSVTLAGTGTLTVTASVVEAVTTVQLFGRYVVYDPDKLGETALRKIAYVRQRNR